MRSVCVLFLLFALSHPVSADPAAAEGALKERTFELTYNGGTSMYPQKAQDASVYAESVSDYDGTACTPLQPPYDCDPLLWTHNNYTNPNSFGYSICNGLITGDYCSADMTVGINPALISLRGIDEQFVWCHEFGHAMGAGHDLNSGIEQGCMQDWGPNGDYADLFYHLHTISHHLQFEKVDH